MFYYDIWMSMYEISNLQQKTVPLDTRYNTLAAEHNSNEGCEHHTTEQVDGSTGKRTDEEL